MKVLSSVARIFGYIKYKVTGLRHKNKFLVDVYLLSNRIKNISGKGQFQTASAGG